jgi:hypothetical protein
MRLLEAVLTKVRKALLDVCAFFPLHPIIAGDTPISYEVLYSAATEFGNSC